MSVEDEASAVEEADRLAGQLCPGFVPSEYFRHDMMALGRKHAAEGHDCEHATLWTQLTTNRYLAVLMYGSAQKDEVNKTDWSVTGIPPDHYPGLGLHLTTGLVPPVEEEMENVMAAFALWSKLREAIVTAHLTDDWDDEAVMTAYMWEGFMAGAQFAQQMERLGARSE